MENKMEIIKDFFDDPKLIRLDLLAFLHDFKNFMAFFY